MPFCEFSHNDNPTLFFTFNNQVRCRVCISYKNRQAEIEKKDKLQELPIQLDLTFNLSAMQQQASQNILRKSQNQDVLVHAVCGAGKTELVLETIKHALTNNQKVGWAIARREVVLQLQSRLASYFKNCKVIAVTQGYTTILDGDLIVCTTHQLFRYYQVIDLLILDKPDAYPYKGNHLLAIFMRNSVKGRVIYLTATPDQTQSAAVKQQKLALVTLNQRPFNHPLPVPIVKMMPMWAALWFVRGKIKDNKKWLLFVPTKKLAKVCSILYQVPFITSESEDKKAIIQAFINNQPPVLISTTILERGVTFSNVHVIVLFADHAVFDQASLIQCSGRVGRDKKFPLGECLFVVNRKSKEVESCIATIQQANTSAFGA